MAKRDRAAKRSPDPPRALPRNDHPPQAGKHNLAPHRAKARNVSGDAERIESQLGTRQQGSVRRSQLITSGISRHVIDRQVRAGALHREHRGVYLVGHLALAPMAREAAALLACGPGSVISHASAAYLWGLIDTPPGQVHVTLVGRRCRPKRGVKSRSVKTLSSADVRRKGEIPLTSPARTIVDLSGEVAELQLERLIAEARVKRLVRDGELERAVGRAGKQKGTGRLRAFLRSEGEPPMTRSEIERVCRRLLRAAGLPQPKVNRKLLGYEVDFLWAEERVVLEVDTYTFHGHRRAFERDRRTTMALEDAGYHVIRVTRRQLLEEPFWVIAHIARALDRHRRAAA